MNAKMKGLAAKTLAAAGKGASVPNSVRASARRILQGSGSAEDQEAVFQFWGVRKTGASQVRRDIGVLNQFSAKIGKYGTLLSSISQGGIGGFMSGLGLTRELSHD